MPKHIEATRHSNKEPGGLRLSYAAIGALVGLLAIAGVIWKIGSAIATKDDVASIKLAITPVLDKHEERIRTLELQMARYFGASQTALKPSRTTEEAAVASFILAQYPSQQYPNASASTPSAQAEARSQLIQPRRVVVPDVMILEYNLQPSRGGTYALLGEDGRYYALDDVLAVIIKMHLEERNVRRPLLKK